MVNLPANHLIAMLLVILAAGSMFGCGTSEKSRYYLLQSITATPPLRLPAGIGEPAVGVGPIKMAEYLNRPQIITRSSGQKLDLAEFDMWAEPLEQNFNGILAENLSSMLSTDRIVIYPWDRSSAPDYQVKVDVLRFQGEPNHSAVLEARWTVTGPRTGKLVLMRHSIVEKPCQAPGYEALVAAESQAVEDLSREIAEAIKEDWR